LIIYKITNNINGKIYIGQTTLSIKIRWKQHCSRHKDQVIQRAIRKYGKKNFTIEEIDGANSLSELNYLEQHYIYIHNSKVPHGYNVKNGGLRGSHSEETRKKMSAAHIGLEYNITKESRDKLIQRNKDLVWTEEMKAKISKVHKNNTYGKGLKRSNEVREKMAKDRKGFNSPARILAKNKLDKASRKPLIATNLKTGEIRQFESVAQAGIMLEIDPSNISRVCRNDQNRSRASSWTFKFLEISNGN
jgi:hypothetical protein